MVSYSPHFICFYHSNFQLKKYFSSNKHATLKAGKYIENLIRIGLCHYLSVL